MYFSTIMYHYVRDLQRSRFPSIKGLSVEQFRGQVQYIKRHYHILTLAQCNAAIYAGESLPKNGILLTFDDGLLDHFTVVFPILMNEGLTGVFYPPGEAVVEGKVLDVHKIHFILASVSNVDRLITDLFVCLDQLRDATTNDLPSNDSLWSQYAVATRLDCKEVIFFKHVLQSGLPSAVRKQLLAQLFARYVSEDEVAFAAELYVSQDQMRTMANCGMEFGSHGWRHDWLNTLSEQEQIVDIDRSIDFLKDAGVWTPDWSMCYPYGRYSDTTIDVLRARGCKTAFTVEVALSNTDKNNAFKIARLDTNDLPKIANANPNDWLEKQKRINE
ncbi:polysaccharide deacetylase family protein [Novipirellula sp. SH528]|uniref:polysaccharide deacetylase family protein n=1 Tax=Novipirellula sp. SH528 TaxID=3454466 RepID=UPI003FA1844A